MNAPASREQVEAAVREWMHENRLSAARNATSLTDMICHMLAAQRTPPGEGSLAIAREWLNDPNNFNAVKFGDGGDERLAALLDKVRDAEQERCAGIASYSINDQRTRLRVMGRIRDAGYGQHVNAAIRAPRKAETG